MFSGFNLRDSIGLVLVVVAIMLWLENKKLHLTINELEVNNVLCDQTLKEEQSRFKATVQKLENEINQYAINLKTYQNSIKTRSEVIDKKTEEVEAIINKELEVNASCENQLNIARRIIDEFSKNK